MPDLANLVQLQIQPAFEHKTGWPLLPCLQTLAVLSSTFRMPGNPSGIEPALPQHWLAAKQVTHKVALWPLHKGGGFVFIPGCPTKHSAQFTGRSLKMRPARNKREIGKFILLVSVMTAPVAKKELKFFQDFYSNGVISKPGTVLKDYLKRIAIYPTFLFNRRSP